MTSAVSKLFNPLNSITPHNSTDLQNGCWKNTKTFYRSTKTLSQCGWKAKTEKKL